MEMTARTLASYVYEKESDLGGKEHEDAYVEAFIKVVAAIGVLLGRSIAMRHKGLLLSAEEDNDEVAAFARSVYWDEEDLVRLQVLGAELDLICNADPIAFVLLASGDRFP